MKLEYSLSEDDFLAFQMHTAGTSERLVKKRKSSRILFSLGLLLLSLGCYSSNLYLSIYFGILAGIAAIFYPNISKWRYKRHFKAFITENYTKRFGQPATLEFTEGQIRTKDKFSEGSINLVELERIDETGEHFFLKISTGHSLIIPKSQLADAAVVRQELKKICPKYVDAIGWKW
jgi:hypothetical protein